MIGEMISFQCNGETYEGYIARSGAGKGPGVIVIQEWWGLVGHIKDVCDRFASEGFTALAPDLYQGKQTEDPDEAGRLMMAINIDETGKTLRCAVERLLEDDGVEGPRAGVVGFCMGGQLALYAACTNPNIGACVNYYGIHPNVDPPLDNLACPVLGFFASEDNYASPEAVSALDSRCESLGKEREFITYPDTHHAFFNNDRPEVYDAEAAEDSWRRMLQFFRENLRQ